MLTRLVCASILAVATYAQAPQPQQQQQQQAKQDNKFKLKSALQSQGCATPGPNQECPTALNGFHFLCGEYSWGEAQSACYAAGYRPAIVYDPDMLSALQVINECLLLGGRRVWIDSFNGLGADPCAYAVAEGAAIYSPGDQLCNELRLPVLCQDAPVTTGTLSVLTSVSLITEGTSTSLTTTCIQCNCQGNINTIDPLKCPSCFANKAQPAKPNAAEEKGGYPRRCHANKPHECSHAHPPHCLDPQGCLPLCPYTVAGLHVIQANLTFNQAERECNKYGWNLADTYAGLHADVGFMQQLCANPEQDYNLWIRSYNGVDGGVCVVTLEDDFFNVPVGFGWSADYCMEQPLYVLCQERAPAVTGIGAFVGSVSFVQETFSYATTSTIPAVTVTSTVTNYY